MDERVAQAVQEATRHLKAGDADAAIAQLNQLGAPAAEFFETSYLLGVALAQKNRLDHALSYLTRATELKPDSTAARYNLAVVLHRQGQDVRATAQLKEVLRQDPSHAQAKDLLAKLTAASHSAPATAQEACPQCGQANPVGYQQCSFCGALSAAMQQRKDAEATEREKVQEQVHAHKQSTVAEKGGVALFYGTVGAIAGASLLLEIWWLVIAKKAYGTSIGIGLLMMMLTFVVQFVAPFVVGLIWFNLAWWVEDKSDVPRASLMLGFTCLIAGVLWHLVIGPTIGLVINMVVPFGGGFMHFAVFYLAVMVALEKGVHVRLDMSYGIATWMTIVIGITSTVGNLGVDAAAFALGAEKALHGSTRTTASVSADIPTYPRATAQSGSGIIMGGKTTVFQTNAQSPQQVADFFKAEMPKKGWTADTVMSQGNSVMLMYSKENRSATIQVATAGQQVTYSVVESR